MKRTTSAIERARQGKDARRRQMLCPLCAIVAVWCAAVVASLALSVCVCFGAHTYPRVGNLFLSDVRLEYAGALSKWDVVGVSFYIQDLEPQLVPTLKQLNPEIMALGYVPVSFLWATLETGADAGPTVDSLSDKIWECDWWLYDDRGNRIGESGNLWCTNLTSKCPPDGEGRTLPEWLGHFMASQILAGEAWDGVILDGAYEQISWINNSGQFFQVTPAAVDCDRDGVPDDPESLDVWWRNGVETLLATLREEAGPDVIIVPNGNNYMYQYANGGVRENFPFMHGGWQENMFARYGYIPMCNNFLDYPANVSMLWCLWGDSSTDIYDPGMSPSFERFNRFTLTSALLGDGYYFLHRNGGSLWWRDYYDLDLGDPVGQAYLDTLTSRIGGRQCAVWRRDFENAMVFCNPFQQYVVLDDGTWLFPEDGLIRTRCLPGPVSVEIDRPACAREFDQNERVIFFQTAIANPCNNAAQVFVWAELADEGTTVVQGLPREILIGTERTDTVRVGMRVPATLATGTYCAKVLISGLDRIPTDSDTMYVGKAIIFDRKGRPVDDGDGTGYALYPQPVRLSLPEPLALDLHGLVSDGDLCSVKIYNVEGRLLDTIFEGRLDAGVTLKIDGRERFPSVPGVYFLQVETERKSYTRKIVLLD